MLAVPLPAASGPCVERLCHLVVVGRIDFSPAVGGLGVAFHGSDSLREQENTYIDHNDLTALLYI
jgi:hypothetical protein